MDSETVLYFSTLIKSHFVKLNDRTIRNKWSGYVTKQL
jgi:ribosomal protein S17E